MNTKDQLRAWLAKAIGVTPDLVTDEHIAQWCALRDSVCAYRPTATQASGARANGRHLGVHIERERAKNTHETETEHHKWFGPRRTLESER